MSQGSPLNPDWLSELLVNAEAGPYAAAPELGQHTEEVAQEMGLGWEEIARLKEAGAIG